MKTYTQRQKDRNYKQVSNSFSRNQSNDTPAFQFKDNRSEAVAQRQLQKMADNSPHVKQAAQLQAMVMQQRPVIQFVDFDKLLRIKTTNEHAFIRKVLGGNFGVGRWKFPNQSQGDGIMGKNIISAALIIPVDGATNPLALHINFMITAGSFTRGTDESGFSLLTFNLRLLHITARSESNQVQIVEDGPSILTAAKSIHCGPNNNWNWRDPRVNGLLTDIGADLEDLQAALRGFGQNYMQGIRGSLMDEIIRASRNREVTVNSFNLDSTWS